MANHGIRGGIRCGIGVPPDHAGARRRPIDNQRTALAKNVGDGVVVGKNLRSRKQQIGIPIETGKLEAGAGQIVKHILIVDADIIACGVSSPDASMRPSAPGDTWQTSAPT